MSRKSSSERKRVRKHAALAKPSDLVETQTADRQETSPAASPTQTAESVRADLPPVMELKLHGGERVRLLADQVFADRDRVRMNEVGVALYPSSQAACWVVQFQNRGPKLRVIPERLLQAVD